MTPAPRRKPAVDGPGPVRLADAVDPPEDPRPEARPQRGSPRGPTLPAGFGRQPEASPDAKPGRTLPASIEPLLHIDHIAEILSCSRRLVERMRAAGKLPRPDIHVGKCPRWKPTTIRIWIEKGGKL